MKKVIICSICLLLHLTLSAQKKYYVKTDGSPSLTGTSWGWALNSIPAALDKAVAGDTIFVATGTYYGGFAMKEGVTVKGGYSANAQNPTERHNVLETDNPAEHSILDGGLTQRVLMQYIPFGTATTWEGFVIQNGKPSAEWQKGSIIYSQGGEPEIVGVLYQYNPDDGKGMFLGLKEIRKQWGGYGEELALAIAGTKEQAESDLDGQANTHAILDGLAAHSLDFEETDIVYNANYAASWCDTLTTGGYENWYLPSAGELHRIYQSGIQAVLLSLKKELNSQYWSSSHAGGQLAWSYNLNAGYFHPSPKYTRNTVSAVHAFEAPADPNPIYTAGGGAFIKNNGILQNCLIKDNQSPSRGGGVYVGAGGELIDCVVEGNSAPEGKEVYYEDPLGIATVSPEAEKLTVYPNPVKAGNRLQINAPRISSETLSFRFLNYSGIPVRQGTISAGQNTIEPPTLPGVYLLVIQSNNNTFTSKLIVH